MFCTLNTLHFCWKKQLRPFSWILLALPLEVWRPSSWRPSTGWSPDLRVKVPSWTWSWYLVLKTKQKLLKNQILCSTYQVSFLKIMCLRRSTYQMSFMLIHFLIEHCFPLLNTSLLFWHPISMTLFHFMELLLVPQNNNTYLTD